MAGVSKQGKKERLHTEWPCVNTSGLVCPDVSPASSHHICKRVEGGGVRSPSEQI